MITNNKILFISFFLYFIIVRKSVRTFEKENDGINSNKEMIWQQQKKGQDRFLIRSTEEDKGRSRIRRYSVLEGKQATNGYIKYLTCLLTIMKILFEVLEMSAYPSAFRVFATSLTSDDSMVQTSKANRMKILMIIFSNDRNININTPPTFLDEGYQV